jgi:hypothetical protein
MTLFLERQINHTVACQIKEKAALPFLFPTAETKQSNNTDRDGGMTITKPSQRKTAFQTKLAKSQKRNK